MRFDRIVVGSHLRYDGVRQRPQHLASRLASRVPVLYVEEAFASSTDAQRIARVDGLDVMRIGRRTPTDAPDAATIAAVRAWVGDGRALVWLYAPAMLELARALDAPLAYDCMDDLAAFDFAHPDARARERAVLDRATVVFTGGRTLFDARRASARDVRLEPSGVEYDHFASARSAPPHPLFARLPRPVCTYVGVIDERIDLEIVRALADAVPTLALVGPVVKIAPASLPRRANVHLTGQLPYAALPSVLRGSDVALVPFARNAATASVSPTKTPEYLAAGLPVVSTPIADVVASYGDVVTIAADPATFAAAVLRASPGDPARRARGDALARTTSWDAIAARMWSALERE